MRYVMKKLIFMGMLAIIAIALFSPITNAQSLLKEDYTDELCKCLIYNAHKQYYLGNMNREDTITSIMDTCYGIHFMQVRTYAPTVDIALDMMHEEETENAYEDLAEAALDFVIKDATK